MTPAQIDSLNRMWAKENGVKSAEPQRPTGTAADLLAFASMPLEG